MYKYIFKYVNDSEEITQEFSADVNLCTLKDRLKRFLSACGWTKEQLDFLDDKEEVYYELTEEGRKQIEKGQI